MSAFVASADSQVVALLCSSLGLEQAGPEVKPLRAKEWSSLDAAIRQSSLAGLARCLGRALLMSRQPSGLMRRRPNGLHAFYNVAGPSPWRSNASVPGAFG